MPSAEVGKITERYLAAVGGESRIRIHFGPVKCEIAFAHWRCQINIHKDIQVWHFRSEVRSRDTNLGVINTQLLREEIRSPRE